MTHQTQIVLNDAERAMLQDLTTKQQAVQAYIQAQAQALTQSGEARMAELLKASKAAWQTIAKDHDLNLDTELWQLDSSGKMIVLHQKKFV